MNKYYIPATETDVPPLTDLLQDAARLAKTKVAKHLDAIGIYAGQEKIFMTLAVEGALPPGKIATRLNVKPPTITKTIIRLEEQGFVARENSDSDKRQVVVRLTDDGEAIVSRILTAIRDAEKEIFDGLKKKERRQLQEVLT
ncbi:MAG: MarR family transcriptional regulator, partial [Pseudomonadota bacterium]